MRKQKGFTLIELLIVIAVVCILVVAGGSPIYGWIKSKTIVGIVDKVTFVMEDGGMAVGPDAARMAKSSAIRLQLTDGSYFTFSSEDRQWFTLKDDKSKKCVKAKVFPYAPWEFTKSGTFHDGRLIDMADTCEKIK